MQQQFERRQGVWESWLALFRGERGTLLAAILAPILIFLALWLPPLSVGARIFDADYLLVPRAGGSFNTPTGAQLTLPAEALPPEGRVKVKLAGVERQAFIEGSLPDELRGAPAALPSQLIIKGPMALASVKGPMPGYSQWVMPLPPESEPRRLLDVYGWNGESWYWLPHKLWVEDGQIEASATGVPQGLALMQAQSTLVQVGALSEEVPDFVTRAGSTLSTISPRLFLIQGDGNIGQLFTPSPLVRQSGALVLPVLHNVEPTGVVRSDLVDNLLIDPNAWRQHAGRIEELVVGGDYDGIILDYRGIDPALRDAYSQFVALLGERLTLVGKRLVVRVGEPNRISEDDFNTGAYDWRAIGQRATSVQVPVPHTAGFFAGSDDLEALLLYATSHINRYNLLLELPAAPYTIEEGRPVPVFYSDVRDALVEGPVGGNAATDGSDLPLDALASLGQLTLDPATGNYRLTLGGREVYLENAETLARRLERIAAYHIGGVVMVNANHADPAIWDALAAYQVASVP